MKRFYAKPTTAFFLAFALLAPVPQASAVAYCALRDPVNTIYELFPEAKSYRSNVQTVGRKAREAVTSQLPFSMHFNELGRHTLYVALKEAVPIGFVHARSESGEWGITEYAWAIRTDLSIQGVKVQRSRDPDIRKLTSTELNSYVEGRGLAGLSAERAIAIKAGDKLKTAVLSSAMKALIIIETVWGDEFSEMPPVHLYSEQLTGAIGISKIDALYDPATLDQLARIGLAESPAFQRDSLAGYRLSNPNNQILALAVRTPNSVVSPSETLWWLVSRDGEIVRVTNGDKVSPATNMFESLLGRKPKNAQACSSLAELAALEISTLTRRHASGI